MTATGRSASHSAQLETTHNGSSIRLEPDAHVTQHGLRLVVGIARARFVVDVEELAGHDRGHPGLRNENQILVEYLGTGGSTPPALIPAMTGARTRNAMCTVGGLSRRAREPNRTA